MTRALANSVTEPWGITWRMTRSTLVASQLPLEHCHKVMADLTVADAILDRLVHNAYKISLKGESMRKAMEARTSNEEPSQT